MFLYDGIWYDVIRLTTPLADASSILFLARCVYYSCRLHCAPRNESTVRSYENNRTHYPSICLGAPRIRYNDKQLMSPNHHSSLHFTICNPILPQKKHDHAIIHPKYVSKHMSPLDIDVYVVYLLCISKHIETIFSFLLTLQMQGPGCSGALRWGHTILRSPGLQPVLLPGGTAGLSQGPREFSRNFQPRGHDFLRDVAVGLSSQGV